MQHQQLILKLKQQTNNFVNKLKNNKIFTYKIKHFKMLFAVAIVLLAIFVMFISSWFFDNTYLQNKIGTHLSKIINANFIIKGNVKVQIIPVPKIVLSNVFIENYRHDEDIYNLYAEKITLLFGFNKKNIKKKF